MTAPVLGTERQPFSELPMLDLQLIDRYVESEMRKNNGAYPDWMRAMDLWALQALAEGVGLRIDHQRDADQFREEMECGQPFDAYEQKQQTAGV